MWAVSVRHTPKVEDQRTTIPTVTPSAKGNPLSLRNPRTSLLRISQSCGLLSSSSPLNSHLMLSPHHVIVWCRRRYCCADCAKLHVTDDIMTSRMGGRMEEYNIVRVSLSNCYQYEMFYRKHFSSKLLATMIHFLCPNVQMSPVDARSSSSLLP